ncbi:MAG: hypothetical protein OXC41_01200 [Gammaproteobacteria bacterium]|nr:hypothetical protein [Gammaproteobacteria bacterium]
MHRILADLQVKVKRLTISLNRQRCQSVFGQLAGIASKNTSPAISMQSFQAACLEWSDPSRQHMQQQYLTWMGLSGYGMAAYPQMLA